MDNQVWCANFVIKTDKKTREQLEVAAKFLHSQNIAKIKELDNKKNLYVEYENEYIGEMSTHTFLFFHDYKKYWMIFKNFNQLDFKFIYADMISKENYLDFSKIDSNDEKLFFTDFMQYVNDNLYNDNIKKSKNWSKNILLSFNFKTLFKNSRKNFFIPTEYQYDFLNNLSSKNIFQYNWDTFEKLFGLIQPELKKEYFKKCSVLNFFNPMLEYAYSYSYKNNVLKFEGIKKLKMMENNFELFFLSNQEVFREMSIFEQKCLFKIFVHNSRKKLVEYMLNNYGDIIKENFSTEEYDDLIFKNKKSTLDMDLDKHFLFKKLNANLGSKHKEKKMKI